MKNLSKKTGLVVGGAALLLVSSCSDAGTDASGAAAENDTVTVQLDYEVRGNHGMFFVAEEKGYFADEGIKVSAINKGSGSPDALRLVGTGGADFGFADLPSLASARARDIPVKAIAAVNQVTPLGMCSLADRNELNTASDLEGKTVGVHPAGSTYYFYEALLSKNGVDRSQVNEVTVTPPYENYLMQNQVDAVVCYIDAEVPLLEQAAGGEGSLSILLGSENGYDAYGSGLFTTDKMINEDPELVQRFTNAYMKAFEFAMENPEETAEIVAASSPELSGNEDIFLQQLQADVDHTFTSEVTNETGLGAMEDSMWQSTIDIMSEQGVIEGEAPAVEDVYDDTFVNNYHSEN